MPTWEVANYVGKELVEALGLRSMIPDTEIELTPILPERLPGQSEEDLNSDVASLLNYGLKSFLSDPIEISFQPGKLDS